MTKGNKSTQKLLLLVLRTKKQRVSHSAIVAEGLHKRYELGSFNSGTLTNDLKKLWASWRGQEDPTLKVTQKTNVKEYWALKGLDFEIPKGASVGVIGKNGAGKSTLLKILSRVTSPTYGEVRINGRIASLLEVGTGFHPELTGRENIYMNGAILGMQKKEIDRKLDEIVSFSGIHQYIDTPVKRYSSGMYVRLAFAVAAHLEPDILIVDEVLAVGDAEFQKKCIGKMKEVNTHGRTVLFVSHDMSAIRNFCASSMLLAQGKLMLFDSTHKVIQSYFDTVQDSDHDGVKTIVTYLSESGEWEAGSFAKIEISWPKGKFKPGWQCDIAAYTLEGIKVFAFQSTKFEEFTTKDPNANGITYFVRNEHFNDNELRLDVGIKEYTSLDYDFLVENCSKLQPSSLHMPTYKRTEVISVPTTKCELIF